MVDWCFKKRIWFSELFMRKDLFLWPILDNLRFLCKKTFRLPIFLPCFLIGAYRFISIFIDESILVQFFIVDLFFSSSNLEICQHYFFRHLIHLDRLIAAKAWLNKVINDLSPIQLALTIVIHFKFVESVRNPLFWFTNSHIYSFLFFDALCIIVSFSFCLFSIFSSGFQTRFLPLPLVHLMESFR